MTEADAKQRWCPFARVNNGQGYNANRAWDGRKDSAFITASRCLASACMAWRERRVPVAPAQIGAVQPVKAWEPATTAPAMPQGVEYRVIGFCGLAGAPQ